MSVRLSTTGSGLLGWGYPSQVQTGGGTPARSDRGGYPTWPGGGGVPQPGPDVGGHPGQVQTGGGVPSPGLLGAGGAGVPPVQDNRWST